MLRRILAVLVTISASAAAQLAPSPVAGRTETLRTGAKLVVVDVEVTDGQGNPVHNLQPGDFSIFENKVQQPIKNFEEHSGGHAAAPTPMLPPGVFSNESVLPGPSAVDVLLLDSLNTPPQSQPYLRDQLVKYLSHARPGTRLAIFALNTRLQMLQGLTSDPSLLKEAILRQGVKFSPLVQRELNDSTVHNTSETLSDLIQANPKFAQVFAAVQSMLLDANARETSGQLQVRVRTSLAALEQLARYLAGIPGRKNLVWFSASFPIVIMRDIQTTGDPFAGMADLNTGFKRTLNLLERSQVAVYPVDARGLETPPSMLPDQEDGSSGDLARTRQVYGNTSISPRDTQFYLDQANEHATMQQMAEATGGRVYENNNGLSGAIDKAISAGDNYYTLSYTPPPSTREGEFRAISVKLKEGGVHLAYRRGYYTDPTPQQVSAAASTPPPTANSSAMKDALLLHSPDATEVLFDVYPQPAPAQNATSNADTQKSVGEGAFGSGPHAPYTATLIVDAKALSFTTASDGKVHGAVDFAVVLFDAHGKEVDSRVDRAVLALDPARYQAILSGGIRFHFNLALPASGNQTLRFAVHDAVTDRVGSLELSADSVRSSGNRAAR